MPKVSVVIPTRNRAAFLKAAILSVLNQTFRDFEIIVVDDASEDATPETVRSFADERIRYIRHETRKGQGVTRNDGIRQASGEYIALLDDDDEWLPQKLETQVPFLDQGGARSGLVYSGFDYVDVSTMRVVGQFFPRKRGYIFEDLCAENCIGTCSTVVVRRACFDAVGVFDETLTSGADWDMWLRLCSRFDVDYVPSSLVCYAVHDNRISTSNRSRIRGIEGLLRKHAGLFAMNRRSYSRIYLSLGVLCCYNGELAKARRAFLRGITIHPFEIRQYWNLALSCLGQANFTRIKQFKSR